VTLAGACVAALSAVFATGQPGDLATRAQARGLAFWQALAADCRVPPGESAAELVAEAVSLLGLPDPAWRDDVGYGVVASCVHRRRGLAAAERRRLVDELIANLRRGIGDSGTDAVLLRSFSALDLSVLAAVEDEDPALDLTAYRQLLDAALGYLGAERDLRALEAGKGWIHATAHTADLLRFLARDARFTPADQARLLDAAWAKLTAAGTPVFTHAEPERLAAALVSVVRRADFDAGGFGRWLARFPDLERRVWSQSPPDPQALDAAQNARDLLRSLFVALSLPAPATAGRPAAPPTADEKRARDALLAALRQIQR
jgi:hypothetical protein